MIDEILPDGWIETKCSEFCSGRNRTFNPSTAKEKSYILYSVPSHATGEPETVTPKEIGSSKQHVSPGDTLISKINPRLNRTWVVGEHANRTIIASTEWIVFAASESFIPKFLAMFLQQAKIRDFLSHNASGVGGSLTRIKPAIFDQVPLPLPPLAEQKRIVAKIEELFSELDAGEESLRRARRQLGVYRQSLLKQAFEGKLTAPWRAQHPDLLEWREVPLSTVIAFTNGFAFKSKEYSKEGIPVVRISDISESGVSLDTAVRIPARPEFEKFRLKQGDIVIAMSGATTGKFGELRTDQKCYQNQRVGCFRTLDEKVFSQRFLHHLLHNLKRQIEKDAYGGAQPNISGKQINAYIIPKPSPPEQQEIVRLLDEQFTVIEQNEREIDAALKRSEALRQSILKKAFTGHLVPQDPTDEPASTLLERIRKERNFSQPKAKR